MAARYFMFTAPLTARPPVSTAAATKMLPPSQYNFTWPHARGSYRSQRAMKWFHRLGISYSTARAPNTQITAYAGASLRPSDLSSLSHQHALHYSLISL
jgi:hypothetical protein